MHSFLRSTESFSVSRLSSFVKVFDTVTPAALRHRHRPQGTTTATTTRGGQHDNNYNPLHMHTSTHNNVKVESLKLKVETNNQQPTTNNLQFLTNQQQTTNNKKLTSVLLFLFFVLITTTGWGQTNPTAHNLATSAFTFTGFSSTTSATYPTSMQGWKFSAEPASALTSDANADFALTDNTGLLASGSIKNESTNGISILNSSTNNLGAICIAVNSTNRKSLLVTWTAAEVGSNGSRGNSIVLQYRVGTSGTWNTVSSTTYTTNTAATNTAAQTFSNIAIPTAVNNQSVVQFRWLYFLAAGTSGSRDRIRIDNITISSSAATPSITGAATATAFTTTYGTESAAQSFSVSGSDLTANLVATAPTGFEVSSDGTTYGSTATFTQTSGSASGTLRIRLAATAEVGGTYNGQNIVLSSTGATNVNITTAASGNSVSQKGLTITGLSAANKTYDGTTTVSVTGTPAYSGLVNSETFSSVGGTVTWAFPDANAGTNKTLTRTGSFTAPSGNYSVTQPSLTATISKATPNITTEPTASDINQGQSLASSNLTGGVASVAGTFGWTNSSTIPSVGTSSQGYTFTPNDGTNYNNVTGSVNVTVNAVTTPTITVNGNSSAAATAFTTTYGTASSVQTFTIAGSALTANITATAPTGFEVSNDGTTYGSTTTFTQTSGSASGTLRIRLAADAAVSGTYNSQNIVLASTGATDVNITTASSGNSVTAKGLTITGLTAASRDYNGLTTVSVTGTPEYSGLVNGQTFSVSGTVTWAFADANAGSNKTLSRTGSYNAPSTNYSVTQPTLTATINTVALTITGLSAADKVYNGNTTVSVTGPPVYSGLVNGETFSVSGTVTWAFPDANVGTNKILTRTGSYSAPSANYTVTQPTLTASITKANQTITFGSLANKTTADVPYTISASTDATGLTVSFSSSNTAVATVSGNTITIQGSGQTTITASQAGDGNYNAATSVNQTLTVTPAVVTLLGWELSAVTSSTTAPTTINATTNNSNLNTSVLSRGSGITPTAILRAFASTGFVLNGTKTDAENTDEFYSFTVKSNAGYKVSLNTLTAKIRRSGADAPNKYIWKYSLNGTTFTEIGTEVTASGITNDGNTQTDIPLSSITALQNVSANTTITFRMYVWGNTNSTSTFSIGRTPSGTTTDVLSVTGFVEVDNSPAIATSSSSVTGLSYTQGSGPSSASSITLSGTNLTAGGGNIIVSGSTNFEVSTTSSTTGFGSSATLSYTGTGTLASNTVWIRLKAGLSVGTYSSETISISGGGASASVTASGSVATPPPANDLCGSATSTTIGSISGTTVAATLSSPQSTTSGVSDVWYSFTPASTCSASFTVSTSTTGQDLDIYVFGGSCSTPGTAVSSGGGSSTSTTSQSATFTGTGGTTYLIRVHHWSGTANSFTLTINDPFTSPAVTSANATSLSSTTATLNGNVTTLGVCPNTTEKGFVYAATSTNSNPQVGGGGVTKVSVAGLTTGAYSTDIIGLTNLTSYSYNAYVYDGTTYTYSNTVSTFTTIPPATNDECSNATALTVSTSLTCSSPTSGTLNGASQSLGRATCDGSTSTGDIADVWYSFIAVNTSHNITVVPESSFDPVVEVRSGTCTGTAIDCEDINSVGTSESFTVTGLTIGATYYIRVYSYTPGVPSTPGFTICVAKAIWENFETGTKTGYTPVNVTLNSGSWNLSDVLLGTSSLDRKNNTKAMRMQNTGTASMNFDLSTGVQTVTVYHGVYGGDGSSSWVLEASADGGTSWTAYQSSAITTSSTTLSLETFSVNLNNTVRLRIRKTSGGGNRLNIDDIDYTPMPVSTPTFSLGETSGRCPAAGTVTYTATANNTTGITYSLDATSLAAGNTINASTGAVTYVAGWSGTSTITASASGTSGPATATHTVSHVCYTVTYNGNGNNLGSVPSSTTHLPGTTVTVSSNSGALAKNTPVNYNFIGWNTQSDGLGTFYAPGSGTFTINANTTLYARYAPQSIAEAPGSKIWIANSGNWTDGNNWSPSGAPTSSSNIYIDAGAPIMNTSHTVDNGSVFTLTGAGTLTINPGRILTITGTADFGGRPVTLKSDATGTASIGQIGNNGSNLSGASAVTVERYMPGQRKWRMLTAPLLGGNNNSIYNNWQNNGTAAGSTGAIFWGPTAGGGIYPGGVGYNILRFNSSTGAQGAWENVTSTMASGSLFDENANKSYIAFVTGPYNTTGNYITGSAVATTLRATGTLRTGQVQFTGLSGGVGSDSRFHMIGNPYASAVNFSAINAQNVNAFYYVWNPNEGTLGRYEPIDRTASSRVLESGQAFLVAVSQGSTGSVTFDEADKSSTTTNAMFRTQNTNPRATMRLFKTVNGTLTRFDEAWVDYQPNANPDIDGNDALKPNNFTENMSIYRLGKDLMVERRPIITVNDTLQLRLWRTQNTNYQIQLSMENFSLPEGSTAVLEDLYLKTSTPIVLSGQQTINFSVNADPASTGERFRIVFRPSVVTSVNDLNGDRGFSVYPNPLVKGTSMQLEFRNRAAGKYTVTLFTIAGVRVQQDILSHAGGTAVQSLKLSSQLSSGTYIAEISGVGGVKEKVKVVVE